MGHREDIFGFRHDIEAVARHWGPFSFARRLGDGSGGLSQTWGQFCRFPCLSVFRMTCTLDIEGFREESRTRDETREYNRLHQTLDASKVTSSCSQLSFVRYYLFQANHCKLVLEEH
ncbi:hypothetical protein HBI80_055400 [Parastagonospora nodorum]|nr:hypothetical protein HBI80_055400 [Parastagonospora nodorum]